MKKIISILCLLSILLTTGMVLCSCFSELDMSFRNADKQIAAYNDPTKYRSGGEFSSEIVHREAEDEYDYIITVDIETYTDGYGHYDKVPNVVKTMKTHMAGYFNDNENVTVYVKVYDDGVFISEYKNWEPVN